MEIIIIHDKNREYIQNLIGKENMELLIKKSIKHLHDLESRCELFNLLNNPPITPSGFH